MRNRAKTSKLIAMAVVLIAPTPPLLAGCTTDGGQGTIKATTSSTQSTSMNFPAVSGSLGSAPTIGAPTGMAPTTLESKDLFVGTGATATPSSTVTAHYALMTWSTGKIISSTWSKNQPGTFSLAQVIPGWQQGIPGMRVGGRRVLVIPPSLGYGETGSQSGTIGPNETLIFVVDLISIAK